MAEKISAEQPSVRQASSLSVKTFQQTKRKLPHWQSPCGVYFVTFHTNGDLHLSEDEREIVLNACKFWDGKRITLHIAVVMPNHVHLFVQPLLLDPNDESKGCFSLSEVLHSIKSFSAQEISRLRERKGQLWLHESYDRIVRDEHEFEEKQRYIYRTPLKEGLSECAGEYPWLFVKDNLEGCPTEGCPVMHNLEGCPTEGCPVTHNLHQGRGRMKYVGLIGYPLGHSISPLFQQAAFDYLGLDIRYELWQTESARLSAAIEGIRQPSRLGANVTIPYKEAVLPLLDELDALALEIGAVNTIVNRGGRLVGYNTDAGGFLQALRCEGGFDPAGKSVVVLGAGGAARAVSFVLARTGAKSLFITDIIAERAHGLVSDLERSLARERGPGSRSCVAALEMNLADVLSGCDLLVNCTPIGMKHSATEGESPLAEELIPKEALVYDIVYNPIETPLLQKARMAGVRTLSGLAMLVYQGAAAFELWTGSEPPIDIMFKAANKALG
jgi:shikimate dehydrogenase